MSNHPHRRRLASTHVALEYGACAGDAELAHCRQLTHDALIGRLGHLRRSGVRWVTVPAPEAPALLEEHAKASDMREGSQDSWSGLSSFLAANPSGYLVIAMARAVKPEVRRR